jgi:hypothetical protein
MSNPVTAPIAAPNSTPPKNDPDDPERLSDIVSFLFQN